MNYFLKLLSALIGGKFIFTKKSFTRFSLQSECSNFNQWEHRIYNRSCEEDLEEELHYFAAKNRWEGWAHLVLP